MTSRFTTLPLGCLLGLSLSSFTACGGSEELAKSKSDAGSSGGAPGAGGASSGGSGTGGAAPLLAPDTAGKACTGASDCGPSGTCAEALTAGSLGQTLGARLSVSGGYCTAACIENAECGEGGLCFGALPNPLAPVAGECRRACETNADCRDGHECAALVEPIPGITVPKTCQPKPVIEELTTQVGKPCGGDGGTSCGAGACLTGAGFPGGYCTAGCVEDDTCGSEGICLPGVYGTQGGCWEECTVDADCARDADGYGCVDRGGRRICVAKQEPLPEGVLGIACTVDGDCAPGACAKVLPSNDPLLPTVTAPGGYCTLSEQCVGGDEACGPGGACTATLAGLVCMKRCTIPSDCTRAGYTCEARGVTNVTVCVPGAKPGDAGAPAADGGSSASGDASAADGG